MFRGVTIVEGAVIVLERAVTNALKTAEKKHKDDTKCWNAAIRRRQNVKISFFFGFGYFCVCIHT